MEWCRVTRHPQNFRRLTDCQRHPLDLGHHMAPSAPRPRATTLVPSSELQRVTPVPWQIVMKKRLLTSESYHELNK